MFNVYIRLNEAVKSVKWKLGIHTSQKKVQQVANKHIKMFNFTCYQEMKIYIKYYYLFSKMAKIKKDNNIMYW